MEMIHREQPRSPFRQTRRTSTITSMAGFGRPVKAIDLPPGCGLASCSECKTQRNDFVGIKVRFLPATPACLPVRYETTELVIIPRRQRVQNRSRKHTVPSIFACLPRNKKPGLQSKPGHTDYINPAAVQTRRYVISIVRNSWPFSSVIHVFMS